MRISMMVRRVCLSLVLLGIVISIPHNKIHAIAEHRTYATPTMSTVSAFREPFKDFFDYEWWLQGSEYSGKGYQYGKWIVIERFAHAPYLQFYITRENPIRGTDSAQMSLDGSQTDMTCYAWRGLWGSPDPDRTTYPNMFEPCYMRFRFRIDEWITYRPNWKVTLGAFGGTGVGPENSWSERTVCIGLQANPLADMDNQSLRPRLRLHYRIGDSVDWWVDEYTQKVLSEQEVSIGDVHTLEIARITGADDGVVAVWFDGVQVPDLTFEGLDTSYPGGVRTIFLGSSDAVESGCFSEAHSPGSRCTITFDDVRVRDQYIGEEPLPITYYDLTLDSSPQGKSVRVGNWIVGQTPVTINVPEGTLPKVGVEPTDFDRWEIEGEYTEEQKELFSNYSEPWYNITAPLRATVTRAPPPPGHNVGPIPTPAIYSDTRITAMYTTGVKHTLNVASNPVATSFTVDELDYATPWNGSLTEGTHIIVMPLTFTVGEKRYEFRNWEDDSTNPTRTVNLVSALNITAYYDVTIIPEFPTLFAWLAVVGVATLIIALSARKLMERTISHRIARAIRY